MSFMWNKLQNHSSKRYEILKIKYGYVTDASKCEIAVTASILVIERLSKLKKESFPMTVEKDGTVYLDDGETC